jgi:hypothetical protein
LQHLTEVMAVDFGRQVEVGGGLPDPSPGQLAAAIATDLGQVVTVALLTDRPGNEHGGPSRWWIVDPGKALVFL